jgi:hypothetical protein
MKTSGFHNDSEFVCNAKADVERCRHSAMLTWLVTLDVATEVWWAETLVQRHAHCMYKVGVAHNQIFRFSGQVSSDEELAKYENCSLEPHHPPWNRMVILYCDVLEVASHLECWLIGHLAARYPCGSALQKFCFNERGGGDGVWKGIAGLFVYLLLDNELPIWPELFQVRLEMLWTNFGHSRRHG